MSSAERDTRRLELGDIRVDVVLKNIKNVHLRVYPSTGRVCISAPKRMRMDHIRAFAVSHLGWIRTQRSRIVGERGRARALSYVDGESHYLWGKRHVLRVTERDAAPSVELTPRRLLLGVRPGSDSDKRRAVVEKWYREQLGEAVRPLLVRWEKRMGVRVKRVFVRRMKTRWGSCNPRARTIRLDTELATRPPECLEYVVVHELVHLLEPTHNARFHRLMDTYLPSWQMERARLDRRPEAD